MTEIAGLIRQFPDGSFILIISFVWACERIGVAIASRNRPVSCNCACCEEETEEDEDEEEEE